MLCCFTICVLTNIHTVVQVESTVDLCSVAKETDGFSGSDLREMCRDAALLCVRDFVHNSRADDRYRPLNKTPQSVLHYVIR